MPLYLVDAATCGIPPGSGCHQPCPVWHDGPMGRVAVLLNQKGGVGKTTVTLGLASAAARAGRQVLVVDLDPQGSSTWVLGHDPAGDQPSTADVIGTAGGAMTIVASHWGPRGRRRRLVAESAGPRDRLAGAAAQGPAPGRRLTTTPC